MADEHIIQLHQEDIHVEEKTVVTGIVNIEINTVTDKVEVDTSLTNNRADVQVITVNEFVDSAPTIRTDGDTTIIPVIEEVMVKKILLKEEIHIKLIKTVIPGKETVTLRREIATVTRKDRTDVN